jgi:putative peptide zinc metalloprotease protein
MNLSEVLNVALPELPARRNSNAFPQIHPKLIIREQLEDGVPMMIGMISGGSHIFRFTPEQWQLVKLFDGRRSYDEVSELFRQQTGAVVSEQELKEFVDALEEGEFWHRTSLGINITASQKISEQRKQRVKKKHIDLALITFSTWDPDVFLTRAYNALRFIYTKWFTILTLAMFGIMAIIFFGGRGEIWRDTVEYYTFTDKRASDLLEFWLLFLGLGYFHECAHGLTCKHFGGQVHHMGFMLIYLSPAFFCDIGEVYVYGGKWQRIASIVAGIWVELMFCSVASVVWWGTPAGSPVHDFAYKLMLITGVAVVLMNLNPLIKLDGYYLLGELVGVSTLKESSTEYLSSWVKRNLFIMPVEVPYLRRGRRGLFAAYAILSGGYSYLVLFVVVRFCYNVSARISPQWAFVPALVLGLMILRSRLRSSWRFMKDLYLDKEQRFRGWWTPPRKAVAAVIVTIVICLPLWRQTVNGRFILEPGRRAVIRAEVPGQIVEVLATESASVDAGAPVLRLRNLRIESETAEARSSLTTAEANARAAQFHDADISHALAERASQSGKYQSASQQSAALQILSPIAGVVVTPRLQNLIGSFVAEGAELAEVDDVKTLIARIYVPEFQIRRIAPGAPTSLKLEALLQPLRGAVASLTPVSSEMYPGLVEQEQYKGIAPPGYYVVMVPLTNSDRNLSPGMSGDAKIQVGRRSMVGFVWENVRDFVQRKVW